MLPQVQQMVVIGGSGSEVATKLYVSYLDYGVTNKDIKDICPPSVLEVLFSEVGMIERYSLNYDRSGRSKGTVEIAFTRQADASAAIKRYDNVQLDGKPMKLELVGVNIVTAAPMALPITDSILGKPTGNITRQDGILGRGGYRGGAVSGGRGSAKGYSQGKVHSEKVSAESLDADLEKYHREAMQMGVGSNAS